jgi:hypothetical protein
MAQAVVEVLVFLVQLLPLVVVMALVEVAQLLVAVVAAAADHMEQVV